MDALAQMALSSWYSPARIIIGTFSANSSFYTLGPGATMDPLVQMELLAPLWPLGTVELLVQLEP